MGHGPMRNDNNGGTIMSINAPISRLAAAVSALAVVAAGGGALASPAGAATSEPLSYDCATSAYDTYTVSAEHAFSDSLVYGGWLTVVSTIKIPASVVSDLNAMGVEYVEGTSVVRIEMSETGGVGTSSFYAPVRGGDYGFDVPASGPMQLKTVGTLSTEDYTGGWETGDTIAFSLDDYPKRDLVLKLAGYTDKDQQVWASRGCELADGQDQTVGELTISKAGTRSFIGMRYSARTGQVVATALVSPPESNATPDGDVRFILKRNGERLGVVTDSLNQGARAVARFDAPRKGRYTLITRYLGSENFGGGVDRLTDSFS